MPFTNREITLSTMPSVPGMYSVMSPQTTVLAGARKAPRSDARRRSSGTHTPLRFARHRTTITSESFPDSGAPTGRVDCQLRDTGEDRQRTDIAYAYWEEEESYDSLVCDVVPLAYGVCHGDTEYWMPTSVHAALNDGSTYHSQS